MIHWHRSAIRDRRDRVSLEYNIHIKRAESLRSRHTLQMYRDATSFGSLAERR